MKRLFSTLKWLYPGMRVKRWMVLTLIGLALALVGLALATNLEMIQWLNTVLEWALTVTGINFGRSALAVPTGLVLAVAGMLLVYISAIQLTRSVVTAVAPEARQDLADRIFQRRHLAQGQRIVVIGGGTGLSTMLRGLKEHTSNIAAIVTVTDNGGSSGRLTQQMGVLPPGDLRNCLVALADAEPTLARLFQFRFEDDHEGLAGHSFGNLFIAAMTEIYQGNYEQAIAATSKVLAIRGKVYPSTVQNVCLLGEMEDGTIVEGETQIAKSGRTQPIRRIYLRPENARPLAEALEAIRLADAIILGPGSVYTSVIPNLLVEGIAEAVACSRAVKVYVCNVMTQPGETDGFTAADHVRVLAEHTPLTDAGRRHLLNHVLVNKERPSEELLVRYAKHGQQFVEPDMDAIRALGYAPYAANLISQSDVVRHDPVRLADAIVRLIT
ncbi:MAG: YvcK family protein [Armatimonadetes bacterium]|nr:YvcK family protein [Armatimonadota bacterium]